MADNDTVVNEEQEATGPALGRKLIEAREARELSIEEIATELRIEPHLLRALEECRFDALGAPVFAKGYLKQYGNRLGLDYRDLLGDYYDTVGRDEIEIAPSRVIKLRDERQITVWVIAALVIGLLGVFLFVWWIDQPAGSSLFGQTSSSSGESPPLAGAAQPPAVTTGAAQAEGAEFGAAGRASADVAARPAAGGNVAASIREASRADLAGRARSATSESSSDARASASDLSRSASGGGGGAEGAGEAADTTAATPAAVPAAAPPAAAPAAAAQEALAAAVDPRALRVELSFSEECWAEITDATGERQFYGIAAPGRRASFAALPPIRFSLGNAGGVEITINGRPYPVPGRARSGDVARFTVAAD